MKTKNKLYAWVLLMAIVLGLGFASIQPTKAKFVLAYDFSPDNDGNAVAYINAYFDGDYNGTMYNDPDSYPDATPTPTLEALEGTVITLRVGCWLNATYADVGSLAEGRNVIRHSVSVLAVNTSVIWSQQNFTYFSGTDALAPMYFYDYDVILDFVPVSGQVYTVIIIYEVFGM